MRTLGCSDTFLRDQFGYDTLLNKLKFNASLQPDSLMKSQTHFKASVSLNRKKLKQANKLTNKTFLFFVNKVMLCEQNLCLLSLKKRKYSPKNLSKSRLITPVLRVL